MWRPHEFAGQSVQASAPVFVLYFPAAQRTQSTPFSPAVYPDKHVQSVTDVDNAGLWVFKGHVTHWSEPVTPLYFPDSQAVHASPSPPVYDASHWHALKLTLAVFPSVLLLAGHAVHASEPTVSLYVLAGHASQDEPSAPV